MEKRMFKIITHILILGTAKLQILIIFVIGGKLSFTHSNQKTQVSAKFPCLKASNYVGGLFYFPNVNNLTFFCR